MVNSLVNSLYTLVVNSLGLMYTLVYTVPLTLDQDKLQLTEQSSTLYLQLEGAGTHCDPPAHPRGQQISPSGHISGQVGQPVSKSEPRPGGGAKSGGPHCELISPIGIAQKFNIGIS